MAVLLMSLKLVQNLNTKTKALFSARQKKVFPLGQEDLLHIENLRIIENCWM